MNRFFPIEHQLLEQFHEQLAAKCPVKRCKPESPLRINSGRGAHALPLTGSLDHRRLTARRPRPAMYRVGTEARFVPEEDIRLLFTSLLGNARIGLSLPTLDSFRVTLISTLQRFLRRQVQTRHIAPIEARLSVTSNLCRTSSRTRLRVHKPKSNPYCIGFLPLTQRITRCSCVAVSVRRRPVPLVYRSARTPRPRACALILYAHERCIPNDAATSFGCSPSAIR
jgi:hypothetical protein